MLTMFGGGLKRGILFRAKRLPGLLGPLPDPKEWMYGYIQVEKTREDDIDTLTWMHEQEAPFKRYAAKPWTVGQYTGKRDKNEAMIYEGDIVKVCGAEETVHEVQWDDDWSGFCLYSKEFGCTAIPPDTSKIEIIGNIHDNPELLE